ncbi:ABC transporter ATP-binding protein [Streptomyces sp. NPDC048565]|uniref:ABC transporter ATP-binding protein n=1 Tax=Streptomyces sp. NPDC048565 TaxID=3155266 RepID=UPI00343D5EA8
MLFRLLRSRLRPYRRQVMLLLLLQLLQTGATLCLPTLNASVIDNGLVRGDSGYVLRMGALMAGVTLAQVGCTLGATYWSARTSMAVGRDLRAAVFDRVMSFSSRELRRFDVPSLITRTTNDVQQVQMLVLMVFALAVVAPVTCLGGIVLALQQDVPLSSLLLAFVPVLAFLVALLVRGMRPLFRQMQERTEAVARVLREQIAGVRVIRAFVRDDHERERFARANTGLTDVALRSGRLLSLLFPAVLLVVNVSSIAVVWFGGQRIAQGDMEIGALTAFLSYLMQILTAVLMTTTVFMLLPRAEISADRIRAVLTVENSVLPPSSPVTQLRRRGHVELRTVEYRYPGAEKPVLTDASLTARPGRTTAVVGSMGCGKSTLLELVLRLSDPTSGTVLVGGEDVRSLAPDVLSASIGYVPQRPYLFAGTVGSNLRHGRPEATDAELWRALETAQATEFVTAAGGLDAAVTQAATNLSGGQRQRLAIARALVGEPDIHLFDDAFSALDQGTELALRRALARDRGTATTLLVTQRATTFRSADHIVVLDEGRVVGSGTHTALMATDRIYQELVLSQLTEEEAA